MTHLPTLRFIDGASVPRLGQGTWAMGERASEASAEIASLQYGLDLGLSLIDTAEMYADGGAERIVAKALAGRRDQAFVVSKVLPSNASLHGTAKACEASLRRLGTDYLDMYLLHWRGHYPLTATVQALQALVKDGKIRRWGVSNFDTDDMQQLAELGVASVTQTNQVLYNLTRRGIEFDLLPWCEAHHVPVMAYSPIEQGRLLDHASLEQIASKHNATAAQVALAWVLRHPNVIAIPKASDQAHLRDNFASVQLQLDSDDIRQLDADFPAPQRKQPLEML